MTAELAQAAARVRKSVESTSHRLPADLTQASPTR